QVVTALLPYRDSALLSAPEPVLFNTGPGALQYRTRCSLQSRTRVPFPSTGPAGALRTSRGKPLRTVSFPCPAPARPSGYCRATKRLALNPVGRHNGGTLDASPTFPPKPPPLVDLSAVL